MAAIKPGGKKNQCFTSRQTSTCPDPLVGLFLFTVPSDCVRLTHCRSVLVFCVSSSCSPCCFWCEQSAACHQLYVILNLPKDKLNKELDTC